MPMPKKNYRNSQAPRPHERRATGAYPYFRLAVWCPRSMTFKDKAKPYADAEEARAFAATLHPGKFKLSMVEEHGVISSEEFEL